MLLLVALWLPAASLAASGWPALTDWLALSGRLVSLPETAVVCMAAVRASASRDRRKGEGRRTGMESFRKQKGREKGGVQRFAGQKPKGGAKNGETPEATDRPRTRWTVSCIE